MIYIVIWEDRHVDPTAHPFTDPDKAISEAKRITKEYARDESDCHDFPNEAGCLFNAQYSEGGYVRVVTAEMDQEL